MMEPSVMDLSVFARANLVAWCVVPYDTRRRGPRARAELLAELGLRRLAWDWRPEHVGQLDAELDALVEHGIELTGVWVPAVVPSDDDTLGRIDPDVLTILDVLRDRGLATQLWTCTEFGPPGPFEPLPPAVHRARVERTAAHLGPLADRANADGHTLALYNHLGWAGEPENQVEVLQVLADRGLARPGIVYQQHHGHAHVDRFAALLESVRGPLAALGINGMLPGAHWGDGKIHPYGHGPRDLELARTIATSGWRGRVSILGHTMDDVADRLRDNLDGLDWVVARLREEAETGLSDGGPSGGSTTPPPPSARIPNPRWPH
ncbi:MAG: sugar phosphate isomerase/epimerase [Actinomycetales bacterium]|nr:sugar phosphate isomerase/epimerase [Actinomycetales bacterium]